MEEKTYESLIRADRENDLDHVDFGGFVFEEGMDYKKYLERQKEEASKKQTTEPVPEVGAVSRKKNKDNGELDSGLRTVRISLVTTPMVARALRLIAAKEAKTVSTFLNDLIRESLAEELGKVIQYLDLS